VERDTETCQGQTTAVTTVLLAVTTVLLAVSQDASRKEGRTCVDDVAGNSR